MVLSKRQLLAIMACIVIRKSVFIILILKKINSVVLFLAPLELFPANNSKGNTANYSRARVLELDLGLNPNSTIYLLGCSK